MKNVSVRLGSTSLQEGKMYLMEWLLKKSPKSLTTCERISRNDCQLYQPEAEIYQDFMTFAVQCFEMFRQLFFFSIQNTHDLCFIYKYFRYVRLMTKFVSKKYQFIGDQKPEENKQLFAIKVLDMLEIRYLSFTKQLHSICLITFSIMCLDLNMHSIYIHLGEMILHQKMQFQIQQFLLLRHLRKLCQSHPSY